MVKFRKSIELRTNFLNGKPLFFHTFGQSGLASPLLPTSYVRGNDPQTLLSWYVAIPDSLFTVHCPTSPHSHIPGLISNHASGLYVCLYSSNSPIETGTVMAFSSTASIVMPFHQRLLNHGSSGFFDPFCFKRQ